MSRISRSGNICETYRKNLILKNEENKMDEEVLTGNPFIHLESLI